MLKHDVEGLDVSVFEPHHVWRLLDTLKGVFPQVEQNQENHWFGLQQQLQSLKTKFVEVVVDLDDSAPFALGIEHFQHHFGVDQTAKSEHNVMFVHLQLLKQSRCKAEVDVVAEEVSEGACFILFTALEIWHHVKVFAEELA